MVAVCHYHDRHASKLRQTSVEGLVMPVVIGGIIHGTFDLSTVTVFQIANRKQIERTGIAGHRRVHAGDLRPQCGLSLASGQILRDHHGVTQF